MNSTAEIVIKNGRANDALDLSKVAARLFRQTYEGKMPSKDLDSYIAADFNHDQQLAELQNTSVTTLLTEISGVVVGYAQVRKKPIPVDIKSNVTTELWRIYLDKNCHGLGIGKLLLSKVKEVSLSISGDQIWLGVWEQNLQAISFYEKHGFQVVGSQEFNIGTELHNDLVMIGSASAF